MLVVPALPLALPEGDIFPVGRLELWFVYFSGAEGIWQQWTGGFFPTLTDRWPMVFSSSLWLALAWGLGTAWTRADRLAAWGGSVLPHLLATAAGLGILSQLVLINGWIFGTRSLVGLATWVAIAWIGALVWVWGWKKTGYQTDGAANKYKYSTDSDPELGGHAEFEGEADDSMIRGWSRRWIPLAWLVGLWVAWLTCAGACLPSYDADVRELDMFATKEYFIRNSLGAIERQTPLQAPRGSIMPAIGIASALQWDATGPFPSNALLHSILASQLIQGAMWIIAIGMVMETVRRTYGLLTCTVIGFLLVTHPGMHELVRLGGGAGGAGLWTVCGLVLMQAPRSAKQPIMTVAAVGAGAFGNSIWIVGVVGLPILVLFILRWRSESGREPKTPTKQLRCNCLLILGLCFMALWPLRLFLSSLGTQPETPGMGWTFQGNPLGLFDPVQWMRILQRLVWDSPAHGLLLVPFAVLGCFQRWDTWVRTSVLWWSGWMLLWLLATDRMDRDWVLATPLLAWPAAAGIQTLQRSTGPWILVPVCYVAMVWSALLMSAWPMSDPRWLAPLGALTPWGDVSQMEQLDNQVNSSSETSGGDVRSGVGQEGLGEDDSVGFAWHRTAPVYCRWVNEYTRGKPSSDPSKKLQWMIIGNSDTFFLTVPTLSSSLRDRCWMDDVLEVMERASTEGHDQATETERWLRERNVGYILIDWQGMHVRDELRHVDRESALRDAVGKLQRMGCLKRLSWPYASGDADCFEVVTPLKQQ
jgi:hypothetical protein